MSANPSIETGDLSEWVEQVWRTRRERPARSEDAPAATDNGAGEKKTTDVEGSAAADTLEQALKQQAIKWLEQGRFLVGMLQELLDENEGLRARVAGLEQDLHEHREAKSEPQQAQEEITVLAPQGGLDMASAIQMKLQDCIDAGKTRLVLDLEAVDYIDSSGLGEIVRAMKRAREAGGDLRLCRPREEVFRILEITGLNKAIALYPTREDALASWR